MCIKKTLEYNKHTDTIKGLVDHGNMDRTLDLATHALVFMVRGINASFTFLIGYFFSANNMKNEALKDIILGAITEVQKIGLRVRLTACDQGTPNQKALKD